MYNSPIEMFITDVHNQILKQQDENIYKAVMSTGINVDKDELLRALRYDRQQYEQGFLAGQAAAMAELVRCKDCKYWEKGKDYEPYCNHWGNMMADSQADDFCSYGERREGE